MGPNKPAWICRLGHPGIGSGEKRVFFHWFFSLLTSYADIFVFLDVMEHFGPVVRCGDFDVHFQSGVMSSKNAVMGFTLCFFSVLLQYVQYCVWVTKSVNLTHMILFLSWKTLCEGICRQAIWKGCLANHLMRFLSAAFEVCHLSSGAHRDSLRMDQMLQCWWFLQFFSSQRFWQVVGSHVQALFVLDDQVVFQLMQTAICSRPCCVNDPIFPVACDLCREWTAFL